MAGDSPSGIRAAPLFFAIAAATLSALLLLSATPTAGAAERRPVAAGNGSLCSGGGDGEDGGCLTIGQAQPELEGFDMTVDPGSGVMFRRSLATLNLATANSQSSNKAGCGSHVPGVPYYSCTTKPGTITADASKCDPHNRNNPCPSK